MPKQVQILNHYTFAGQKLSKTVFDNKNNLLSTERYVGNLVLENNMPSRILHEDGVINFSGGNSTFHYHLKDHLGNVRLVIAPNQSNQVQIIQANDYYPFGMVFSTSTGANKYLYNGKEEQEMPGRWLDYGARFYDPALARFHTVDPLAEKYHDWSPYVYVYNNPIFYIDMDGQEGNPYDKYKSLSPAEKSFIKNNKVATYYIYRNSNRAWDQTEKQFGRNGRNDKSDAFRHTLWQALNTQSVGKKKTKEYADAHETATPKGREKEKEMDDHNNSLGIKIGIDNPNATLEDIVNAVLNSLNEGEGVVIDPETGQITPTIPDPKPEPMPEPKPKPDPKPEPDDGKNN